VWKIYKLNGKEGKLIKGNVKLAAAMLAVGIAAECFVWLSYRAVSVTFHDVTAIVGGIVYGIVATLVAVSLVETYRYLRLKE